MPEPLADRHNVNARVNELRGVSMPKRVEGDIGHTDRGRHVCPFSTERARGGGPAFDRRENQILACRFAQPSLKRSLSCARRCSRSASTTISGRVMSRRPAFVLGCCAPHLLGASFVGQG